MFVLLSGTTVPRTLLVANARNASGNMTDDAIAQYVLPLVADVDSLRNEAGGAPLPPHVLLERIRAYEPRWLTSKAFTAEQRKAIERLVWVYGTSATRTTPDTDAIRAALSPQQ